jgi:hypothetical protein
MCVWPTNSPHSVLSFACRDLCAASASLNMCVNRCSLWVPSGSEQRRASHSRRANRHFDGHRHLDFVTGFYTSYIIQASFTHWETLPAAEQRPLQSA